MFYAGSRFVLPDPEYLATQKTAVADIQADQNRNLNRVCRHFNRYVVPNSVQTRMSLTDD